MSKDEKKTEEKVLTKYDQKVQKRKEEKIQEKRERAATLSVSVILLMALVAFVLYFPIKSYISLHKTFVTVGNENLTEVEFDYSYNVVKNNYINSYGMYLSYFGLDTTKDLAEQQYDEYITWKDYFQEMAADNLVRSKSIKAQAMAAGFDYNTDADYNKFVEDLKRAADSQGVNLNDFVKNEYGPMATLSRIEPFVREGFLVTAYYDKLKEDNMPTDEEVQAKYEEDKNEYDSVDYRVDEIYAAVPTEPTELADEDAEVSEDVPYEASQAEIDKAMKEAKVQAEESKKTVKTSGEQKIGAKYSSEVALLREWLFDSSRKAGDTEILEDTYSNKYYVVAFEKRYLDETPSANIRALITTEDGQIYLDQWKNGAATEDSFATLCDKFSLDTSVDGGLYEHLMKSDMSANPNLSDWIFDPARQVGDVTSIQMDETYNYVAYYAGQDKPEWILKIRESVSNDRLTEYVEKICEETKVSDPSDNLAYIKKREAQKAAEEAEAAAENAEAETDAEVEVVE